MLKKGNNMKNLLISMVCWYQKNISLWFFFTKNKEGEIKKVLGIVEKKMLGEENCRLAARTPFLGVGFTPV